MTIKSILVIISIMFCVTAVAQGKFCIAEIDTLKDRFGGPHANEKLHLKKIYDVQIDKLKKIRVSETKFICLDKLSVEKKHLVKIYRDNVLQESFWFTFDKGSPKKCLQYNEIYQTWLLKDGICH